MNLKDLSITEWSSKPEKSLQPLPGVRVVHLPTGIVVEVDRYRAQYQNKDYALKLLAKKLKNTRE